MSRPPHALSFLETLPDYSKQSPLSYIYGENTFNLDRFRRFLKYAQIRTNFPTILITGSKGKTTTAHVLSRLLRAEGFQVGLFTSPYLYDLREMIRLNNRLISEADFSRAILSLAPAVHQFPGITHFEMLTASALRFFQEKKIDFCVMEVGMGGRLDATNVCDPMLSILTPVELEHTQLLGGNLRSILREKLGICRRGVPLVIGSQSPRARGIICDLLKSSHVPLLEVNQVFPFRITNIDRFGSFFALHNDPNRTHFLSLVGRHFVEDALLALLAFCTLLKKPPRIDAKIARVFRNLKIPGRFEIRHFSENSPLILDVLHTPQSARCFRETLDVIFPNQNFVFLMAFLNDKPVKRMVKNLIRQGDRVIFTKISRDASWTSENNLQKAFHKLHLLSRQGFLPCVVGSNFLLREARKLGLL